MIINLQDTEMKRRGSFVVIPYQGKLSETDNIGSDKTRLVIQEHFSVNVCRHHL